MIASSICIWVIWSCRLNDMIEPWRVSSWVGVTVVPHTFSIHRTCADVVQICRNLRRKLDGNCQPHCQNKSARVHLTRTSSAAARGSGRGCGLKGCSHLKTGSTTARRQLQRLVRFLFEDSLACPSSPMLSQSKNQ